MYVLQVENTNPPIYIGVSGGFFEKVTTVNEALQLNRIADAQAMQTIIVDSVVLVNIP